MAVGVGISQIVEQGARHRIVLVRGRKRSDVGYGVRLGQSDGGLLSAAPWRSV